MAFAPTPEEPLSYGVTNDGVLRRGVALPERGRGYVRARPGDDTRWGNAVLTRTLTKAAEAVADAFPGTRPLRVGDLSWRFGGRHPRHGSHRSGRDADVLFYAVDGAGGPVRGLGFYAYDRHGMAHVGAAAGPDRGLRFFDDARNWQLVRTMLLDEAARVQWIFCSNGIKSRLLRYAAAHEPSPDALFRAAWVLHEPSRGRRHDDHFHIRVLCSAEERARGCRDRGPIWPWLRKESEKPAGTAGATLSDEKLVEALLSESLGHPDALARAP